MRDELPTQGSRPLRWAVAALLILTGLGWPAFLLGIRWRDAAEYTHVVAELDRSEPEWRIGPVALADQPANEVVRVIEDVDRSLPPGWEPPSPLLPAPATDWYTPPDELVAVAYRIADLPATPAPSQLDGADWLPGPPPPFVRAADRTLRLLAWDGTRRASGGDPDGAARAAAATAVVRRTLADDPRPAAVRVRLQCSADAVAIAAVALAHGPVPGPVLDRFAAALNEEPADSVVAFADADRAVCHACLEEIRTGQLASTDIPPVLSTKRWHARTLIALTRSVAFARSHTGEPLEVTKAALPGLTEEFRAEGPVGGSATPAVRAWAYLTARHVGTLEEMLEAVAASNARVRCARAGLAAERYRLARGGWPEGPAGLVPDLLPAWHADPRDGRPLQWERDPRGLSVRGIDSPPPPRYRWDRTCPPDCRVL